MNQTNPESGNDRRHRHEEGDLDPKWGAVAARAIRAVRPYFRARVEGLENVPSGPALLVGNHNGGVTFMEPFFLGEAWVARNGTADALVTLGHDAVLGLPILGPVLRRLGIVRAERAVAAGCLKRGRKVMVFPGGSYESWRPFSERHRIDFAGRTGYVRLAIEAGVPIVPVLSAGGHHTLMVLKRGARLARWTGVKKLLRADSFPIFIGLPWGVGVGPIFHLPLPAKLRVEVGEPISVAGYSEQDAADPEVRRKISAEVQARLQQMMDRAAEDN